ENLRFLSDLLAQRGYDVRAAISGQMALTIVKTALPSLILLDILMPDMDGYEVCHRLKADPKTAEIPVIFLSALDELSDKITAFDA
ncbi:response regulator, partial [Streptococcus pyogenes]